MLSNKAAASGRSGGGIRMGRFWLRPAAASGRSGGGIGRLRLRPAIPFVPGGRGKRRRRAAAVPPLPDDALVEILSRVPAKSLCRFKCVSKAWRDLIADRLRCSRLPQTLEGFFYVFAGGDDETEGGSSDAGGVSPGRAIHGHFINTLGKSSPLASLSFLEKQPGIEELALMDSCNGILLLGHRRAGHFYDGNSLGYIVCNPATEQWVAVPSCGWRPDNDDKSEDSDYDSDTETSYVFTYLIFDPVVSSHFQLVQFWKSNGWMQAVHNYSSETGVWCERESTFQDNFVAFFARSAFVSGMLHLSANYYCGGEPDVEIIVAVDGEGETCRPLIGPVALCDVAFIGQSQGRLHYMNEHGDNTGEMTGLSIWVLQDYDKEEWVLKHSVTFLQLFGRTSCRVNDDYSVVAIHPDRNMFFFFQIWDLKLKSYDMDSEEVCTLRSLGICPRYIVPYVPYFVESSALAGKH